ncbi:MAG: hypothetical protein K2N60_11240 [Oscillospiraceae bacterium]|nr:hypothetical protein [Oscillospiraceae bacterium]
MTTIEKNINPVLFNTQEKTNQVQPNNEKQEFETPTVKATNEDSFKISENLGESGVYSPESVSSARTGIIQNSQVGTYTNISDLEENNDTSAYISISQNRIYLYNVYVQGQKIRATIDKDGTANQFSIVNGNVTIDLSSYMVYKNGTWTTGTEHLSDYGTAKSYNTGNPLNPQWEITIGNQTFLED